MDTFLPNTFHGMVDHDPLQPRLVRPHGPDSGPIFSDAFGRLPNEIPGRHPSARGRHIEAPSAWGSPSAGYRRRPPDTIEPSRRSHAKPVSDSKKADTTKKASADPKQIQVTIHIHGAQNSAAKPEKVGNKASKSTGKVNKPAANKPDAVKTVKEKTSRKQSDSVRIAHLKSPSHSILREILDRRPIVIIRNNIATSDKKGKVTSSKTSFSETWSSRDKLIKSKTKSSISREQSSHIKKSNENANHLKHSSAVGEVKPSHNNGSVVVEAVTDSQRRRHIQHKAKTVPKDFGSLILGSTNQVKAGFQNDQTNSRQKAKTRSSKENYRKKAQKGSVKTGTSVREKNVLKQKAQKGVLFQENPSGIKYNVHSDTQGGKTIKGNFTKKVIVSNKEQVLKSNINAIRHTSIQKTKPVHDIAPDHVSSKYIANKRDPKPETRKAIAQQADRHVSQASSSVKAKGSDLYEIQHIGKVYQAKKQTISAKYDTSQQSQHVKPQTEVAHTSGATQKESPADGKEARQSHNSHSYLEQSQIQRQVKMSSPKQAEPAAKVQANYDPVLLSLLAMMIRKDAQRVDSRGSGQSNTVKNHATPANSEISSKSATNVKINEHHIPASVLQQLQLSGIDLGGAGIASQGNTGSGLQRSILKQEIQSLRNSQQGVRTPKHGTNIFEKKVVQEVPTTSAILKHGDSIGSAKSFQARKSPIKADIHNTKANSANQATHESHNINQNEWGSAALKKESQMGHKTDIKGPVIRTKISVETHVINPNSDAKHVNQQTQNSYQSALDMHGFSVPDRLKTVEVQNLQQGLISKVHTKNEKHEFHDAQHEFPNRQHSGNLKEQTKTSTVETRTTKVMIPESWLESKTQEEAHLINKASHNSAKNNYKPSGPDPHKTGQTNSESVHLNHYSSRKQYKTSGPEVNPPTFTYQIQQHYPSESQKIQFASAANQQASNTHYRTPIQREISGSIFSEAGPNPKSNKPLSMETGSFVAAPGRNTIVKSAIQQSSGSQVHLQSVGGAKVLQSDLTGMQQIQSTQDPSQLQHGTSGHGMHVQGLTNAWHDQQPSYMSKTNNHYMVERQTHQQTSTTGLNNQHSPSHLQANSKTSQAGSHTPGSNLIQVIQQILGSSGSPSHDLRGVGLHKTPEGQPVQFDAYNLQTQQTIPGSDQPTKMSTETYSQETSYTSQSKSPLLQDRASVSKAMQNFGKGQNHPAMNVETNLQVTSYRSLSSNPSLQGHVTVAKGTQPIAQNSKQPTMHVASHPHDGTVKSALNPNLKKHTKISDPKQSVGYTQHYSKITKNNLALIQSHSSQNHKQDISGVKIHQTGTTGTHKKEPTQYATQVQHDTPVLWHDRQDSYIPHTNNHNMGVGQSQQPVSAADPNNQHYMSNSPANQETVNTGRHTARPNMIQVMQESSGYSGTKSHDLHSPGLHRVLASAASASTQYPNMQSNPETLKAGRHTEGSNIAQLVQQLIRNSGAKYRDMGGSSAHQQPEKQKTQMAAYDFQTQQKAQISNQPVVTHLQDAFHTSLSHYSGSQDQAMVSKDRQKSNQHTEGLVTNPKEPSVSSLFNSRSSQQHDFVSQGTLKIGQRSNQAVKRSYPSLSNIPNSPGHSTVSEGSHYFGQNSVQLPMSVSTHPQNASSTSLSNSPGFELSGSVGYQTLSADTQQQLSRHNTVHSAGNQASSMPTASHGQQGRESIGPSNPKQFTTKSFAQTESLGKIGAGLTKSSPYQSQTNNHNKGNRQDGIIGSQYNSHTQIQHIGTSGTLQTGNTQPNHVQQNQPIAAPGTFHGGSVHNSNVKQGIHITESGALQKGMLKHNTQSRKHTATSESIQTDPAQPSYVQQSLYMSLLGMLQADTKQPRPVKKSHHIAASGTIQTSMSQPSHIQQSMHIEAAGTSQTNTALQSRVQQSHQIVGPETLKAGTAQQNAQPKQHTPASETTPLDTAQPSPDQKSHYTASLGILQGNTQLRPVELSQRNAASGTIETGTTHIQKNLHIAARETAQTNTALHGHVQQSHHIVGPGTLQAGMAQHNAQSSQHLASSGTMQTGTAQPGHVQQNEHSVASGILQTGITHPSYDQLSHNIAVSGTLYSGSAQLNQDQQSHMTDAPGAKQAGMSQRKAQASQHIIAPSKILQTGNIQHSHIQQSQPTVAEGTLHPGNTQLAHIQEIPHILSTGTVQAGPLPPSHIETNSHISASGTSQAGLSPRSQPISSQETFQTGSAQLRHVQQSHYMVDSGTFQTVSSQTGHVQQSQHIVASGTLQAGTAQPNQTGTSSHTSVSQSSLAGYAPRQDKTSSGTFQTGSGQPGHVQQSLYIVDSGTFQTITSQPGHVQQSQHMVASGPAQPYHISSQTSASQPVLAGYVQAQRKTPSGTFQPDSAQPSHGQQSTPSGTFQPGSAQPSHGQQSKNIAASENFPTDFAQPDKIEQHIPTSWSQNSGPTHNALQEQYNQQTLSNHGVGSQQIYNTPDTLETSKRIIPASWSENLSGSGSQHFQVPDNTQGKHINIHRQQEQSVPSTATKKHSPGGNMMHNTQPGNANYNQQSVYSAKHHVGSELPGRGVTSMQHANHPTNLYPTNQHNNIGSQTNTARSVPSQNADQHKSKRAQSNQQSTIIHEAFREPQPYMQQSTVQDIIASRQPYTGPSTLNQHGGSVSPKVGHDPKQHVKKEQQKAMGLVQDPQNLSHFPGNSAVSYQSQTHSNQEPSHQKLQQDNQVNSHKAGASKAQDQQSAAKRSKMRSSGPYKSQQQIYQQFDTQFFGPSAVHLEGQRASYHNPQGQSNPDSRASKQNLYQSQIHSKFQGQQSSQDGQKNSHAAFAPTVEGIEQNDPYLNQQPTTKRIKMQSSGPYQSQHQIHQQFATQTVVLSAAQRAGQEASHYNPQGQSNLGSGPNQQDLYQSNSHPKQELRVQQLPGDGQITAAEASKVHGNGQNDPYLNQQLADMRSKMHPSGPYKSQQQIHQQFDTQNFGPSIVGGAGQEASYHNLQGQYNPGSGPSQQDLYQSQTHSNREFRGKQLPLDRPVNSHTVGASKVHGTRQDNPYLNRQSAPKRSKTQSSALYQSQHHIVASAEHRAGQKASYNNPQGQSNLGSGLSQQDLYQSQTHSNRDLRGQQLQELSQNWQVNSHAVGASKVHSTRQNDPNLSQQSVSQRKEMQPSGPYQGQQQTDQKFNHQNFGQSVIHRTGQEEASHYTEGQYNPGSDARQQDLYQSWQPTNTAGAVGSQSYHRASQASQKISDYQSGQSQQNVGQPLKQITRFPRASSNHHTSYPLHQSDQKKSSTDTPYTGQASIQPHLPNRFKIDRFTTKLPNELHIQYSTNLTQKNLKDARGIHHTEHFVSQHNINAKYQAERVTTKLPKTQVMQNAHYNSLGSSPDQTGLGPQNNGPYYLQEVIKGQYQFEKLTTLLPKPKYNEGSPNQSTVDIPGFSGVVGQEHRLGPNVTQVAPIVEPAKLTKGKQGEVQPESNTNTHHEPQHTYISSPQIQTEQKIDNVGKQTGKPVKKNVSSHSEGSKHTTGQTGTNKLGLEKASVNLIRNSQPQMSKRDKGVKATRKTSLSESKQYVTKTLRALKYDAAASKATVLGPYKANPIPEGTLKAKTNKPHNSDRQTSKATRKKQKTQTKSQVRQQSKTASVEHISKVSRADLAQPGVGGKQSQSHVPEVFIPSTKNSFDAQVPNTTPVFVDAEVLFELNESRRMKGLPPLKKEQVDINGDILPQKASPNTPLVAAHAPSSNQKKTKGHVNPPANQIRANGDLNARLDALISLLYVQRFTHEVPTKFVITQSVINTTKDPYADLKKTDPEAYLEILESRALAQGKAEPTNGVHV